MGRRKKERGAGLRTSREVYDRIRWDPNLDERVFLIGYEERFSGLQERSFAEFSGEGEIPWHRVWHFRVGDLMVWNRAERIDRLFGSGEVAAEPERIREAIARARAAAEPNAGLAQGLRVLDVVRFDVQRGEWVVDDGDAPAPRLRSLCIVSYNVLFDLYDPALLHTECRTPALLSRLRREKADLIALQEVTPALLESILAQPWVREGYRVSEGPAAESVRPYGQVLLSRVPLRAQVREVREGGHKRLLYGEVCVGGHRVTVAVVHLTSDRAKRAEERRREELSLLQADLAARGGSSIVVGDFNADDEALEAWRRRARFVDVWRTLRPHEAGATFDPQRNDLARHSSRTGKTRRLDRLWLGGEGSLRALDITRIGMEPEARAPGGRALHLSDHYGLRARLSWSEAAAREAPSDAPVHRSAVVVIPPHEHWEPIQSIRRSFDRAHPRWMPHITMLYGFVPPERLDDASEALERALAEESPFTASLETIRCFEHRRRHTVWLEPRCEEPGALERLQQVMQAVFPQCDECSRRGGFTPHLTLGQLPADASAQTMAQWQERWTSRSFTVGSVAVIVRRGDDPFVVHRVIPLGGPASVSVSVPALEPVIAQRVAALRRAWAACVGAWPLAVVGSHRLGVAGPDADLDVVGFGPASMEPGEAFERLSQTLREQGHRVEARAIVQAAVPRLALVLDGQAVDVQHARWPSDVAAPEDLENLAEHPARDRLDAASHDALLAVLDAEALLVHAARHGGVERFVGALRQLRAWAATQDVSSNALGYPGGLAWAVMLGRAAAEHPLDPCDPRPEQSLLRACIRGLSRRTARDWSRIPVTLADDGAEVMAEHVGPMVVVAPAAPSRNCTARATASTVAVLEQRLDRAVRGDALEPEPLVDHRWLVTVAVRASTIDPLERARGIVMGRAAGMIRSLEQELGIGRLRPFGRWWFLESGEPVWTLLLGVMGGEREAPVLSPAWCRERERELVTTEGWPSSVVAELRLEASTDIRVRYRED